MKHQHQPQQPPPLPPEIKQSGYVSDVIGHIEKMEVGAEGQLHRDAFVQELRAANEAGHYAHMDGIVHEAHSNQVAQDVFARYKPKSSVQSAFAESVAPELLPAGAKAFKGNFHEVETVMAAGHAKYNQTHLNLKPEARVAALKDFGVTHFGKMQEAGRIGESHLVGQASLYAEKASFKGISGAIEKAAMFHPKTAIGGAAAAVALAAGLGVYWKKKENAKKQAMAAAAANPDQAPQDISKETSLLGKTAQTVLTTALIVGGVIVGHKALTGPHLGAEVQEGAKTVKKVVGSFTQRLLDSKPKLGSPSPPPRP